MCKILASVAVLLVLAAGVLAWRIGDAPPSASATSSSPSTGTSAPTPPTSSGSTSSSATSSTTSSPATSPIVRLRRGTSPSRATSALQDVPQEGPEPTSAGEAPSTGQPRQVTLDDLDPTVRDQLGHAAMGHLHDLADACEGTLSAPEDLGAFVRLDRNGVVELELRPIASEPGDIQVEERDLPQALVDCLDERLWSQDWSDVGPSVPEGAELPVALTMRLSP